MAQPPTSGVPDTLAPQWADTYRFLDQQVAALTAELHELRGERLAQLAEKEALAQRLQGVLDALPGAVVVLNGAGRVQGHNQAAARLFGAPLAGEPWREVIARCFVPEAGPATDLVLHDGRIVTLSTCPLGSEPGQILLFQDVTENRRLQAHLQRHQRLLDMGRMAASLAHQIRTPLAAALLYASQLKHPALNDDKRRRFADRTVASLQQLEGLIANMLHFARGGVNGEEPLAADELLQALRSTVEGQTDRALTWSCAAEGMQLRGNRTLLLSAWQNLVNNALQAAGEGGRIEIFCRPAAGGGVELGVHDTGPGVAPEMQARLFEPFSTTRPRGTGLGLAIVRTVAQAHHGDAWCRSQPGDTTFAMRLPSVPAASKGGGEIRRAG
ncbi:MAG: PAS domain-containing sensor histidine kinase [Gammaproteobacteria bacterium HGW-Gammaproteobacteria-1]|jgi:two-component system sensor histidine kinase FlrB|nr:MAG: PAS domain-containing sensor histidine kinase [Gammaproteobacteria bacterium HGW-Gammaproteobacteria-1]